MKNSVWDRLADKYDRLWVQKYSLTPTRNKILSLLSDRFDDGFSLLDLGCATGQLLGEIGEINEKARLFGMDKSAEMIARAGEKVPVATFFRVDIDDCHLTRYIEKNSLDVVVCCHSFPYYGDKETALSKISALLKDGGVAIFAQASVNRLYDRFVLWAVEKTAEAADYLSRKDFRGLAEREFLIESEFTIKERFYMPSICGFVMRKRL